MYACFTRNTRAHTRVHICVCVCKHTRTSTWTPASGIGSAGPARVPSSAPLRAVPLLAQWEELLGFLSTSKYKRTTGTNKPVARSDCGSPSCRSPHKRTYLWTIIVLEAPRPPPLAPLDLRLIESRRCGSPADCGSASQVRTDAQTRIWPLGRAWFRWHKCRRWFRRRFLPTIRGKGGCRVR